jgi:phosphopantetheine--protein transferase-like protein
VAPLADVTTPAGGLVGLGIDSVDIDRFGRALLRRPAMAGRLFTDGERSYAARLTNPVPSLAARFAVKEAVMKALGVGLGAFDWSDIEVHRQMGGAPELRVRGRAAVLAAERGIGGWHVSITHTATVASAAVAAVT